MQLCSWKQCGQVAWFPPLASGFGFVDISSEIGLSAAANGSAVATWNHLLRVKTGKKTSIFKIQTGMYLILRAIERNG